MTNRVILGTNGAFKGLRISKPTFDVLTTSTANLMFDSSAGLTQVFLSGTISAPVNAQSVTVNFTGYSNTPLIDITRKYFRTFYFGSYSYSGYVYSEDLVDWVLTANSTSFTLTYPAGGSPATDFGYIVYGNTI